MTLPLLIANHCLAIESAWDNSIRYALPGFSAFHEDAPSKWTMLWGDPIPLPENREQLYRFHFKEGNYTGIFSKLGRTYYFEMGDMTMRHTLGNATVYASATNDRALFRFAVWFAYTLLAATCHTTLIHASAIFCHGKAVLFLGESGTGKSTHSQLWLNHIPGTSLLNDDSPALTLHNGVPYVFGSPWSGKTPCYLKEGFPLKAVVRLCQAPHNEIHPLTTIAAFSALLPSCPPALTHDETYSDLIVNLLSAIISTIPAYQLQCLPNADAAQICYQTIFQP